MPDPIKLSAQRFRVVLCDPNDPDNVDEWIELEVQTRTPDLIAAESMLRKRDKLGVTDAPIRATAYQAYAALRRTRQIDPETTWVQFESALLESQPVDVDEDEDTDGLPTLPAPAAG